jgi:hypothetical protein
MRMKYELVSWLHVICYHLDKSIFGALVGPGVEVMVSIHNSHLVEMNDYNIDYALQWVRKNTTSYNTRSEDVDCTTTFEQQWSTMHNDIYPFLSPYWNDNSPSNFVFIDGDIQVKDECRRKYRKEVVPIMHECVREKVQKRKLKSV